MTQPPCKTNGVDCASRAVGCRGKCAAWKEWQEVHKKELDKIQRNRVLYRQLVGFEIDQYSRIQAKSRQDQQRERNGGIVKCMR